MRVVHGGRADAHGHVRPAVISRRGSNNRSVCSRDHQVALVVNFVADEIRRGIGFCQGSFRALQLGLHGREKYALALIGGRRAPGKNSTRGKDGDKEKGIESRNRFMGVLDVGPPAFDRCRLTGWRSHVLSPVPNRLIMPGIDLPGKRFYISVSLKDRTLTSSRCRN